MAQKSLAEWYEETYRKRVPAAAEPAAAAPGGEEVPASEAELAAVATIEPDTPEAETGECAASEPAECGADVPECAAEEPCVAEATCGEPAATGETEQGCENQDTSQYANESNA